MTPRSKALEDIPWGATELLYSVVAGRVSEITTRSKKLNEPEVEPADTGPSSSGSAMESVNPDTTDLESGAQTLSGWPP